MIRKMYLIGQDFATHMKKQNISAYAASIAFFFFLSLVPMLILICTIIPYTPLTEDNLVTAVTDLTPDRIDPLAESLIADVYDKSAGILSIALFATIWSAAKGGGIFVYSGDAGGSGSVPVPHGIRRPVGDTGAPSDSPAGGGGVFCHEFQVHIGLGGADNVVCCYLYLCA